ncbi:MAG: hypothetical protein H7841_17255 [Magnetospirillum sp. WYHS-4]
MEELLGASPRQEESTSSPTLALFLGLYLLILAFFILLVSISTTEDAKAKAVMEGLTSTFASLLSPTSDPTNFTSKEGDLVAAGAEFQEQIAGTFAAEIQITRVEAVTPGRAMRVVMPADALFVADQAHLRDNQMPLLDRIVAELSRRSPGMRYEMELVLNSKYAIGRDLPVGQTLESARAGTFARAMAQRGVPPESVSVALKPGEPKELVLWFLSRPLDEARVRFDLPARPAAPAPKPATPASGAKVEAPLPPPVAPPEAPAAPSPPPP